MLAVIMSTIVPALANMQKTHIVTANATVAMPTITEY
jgi:hypothetical protein